MELRIFRITVRIKRKKKHLKKAHRLTDWKMKILAIDDEQDLLELLKIFFASEGHEYVGVLTGQEGLKKIKDEIFDMVLLDLAMPDFSGVDVIDALIDDGLMKKQKIVIFTASSATEKEFAPLLEKGVYSIIKKPVDFDVLSGYLKKIESEN